MAASLTVPAGAALAVGPAIDPVGALRAPVVAAPQPLPLSETRVGSVQITDTAWTCSDGELLVDYPSYEHVGASGEGISFAYVTENSNEERTEGPVPGGTLTIWATISYGEGFDAPADAEGWEDYDGMFIYRASFSDHPSGCPATVLTPVITEASCAADGSVLPPTFRLPGQSDGAVYSVSGEAAPGALVTATVRIHPGYQVPEGLDPAWSAAEEDPDTGEHTSTLSHTFAQAPTDCVPSAPQSPTPEIPTPGNEGAGTTGETDQDQAIPARSVLAETGSASLLGAGANGVGALGALLVGAGILAVHRLRLRS